MLLAPEFDQYLGKPAALPQPAVNPGVAGGAKSDEQFRTVNTGKAVVDGHAGAVRLPRPAAFSTTLALAAVACENGFAVSIEVAPGMRVGAIAAYAESGDRGNRLATGAKQDFLLRLGKPAAQRDPAGRNGGGSLGLGWERHDSVRIAEPLSISYIIISCFGGIPARIDRQVTEPRHFAYTRP